MFHRRYQKCFYRLTILTPPLHLYTFSIHLFYPTNWPLRQAKTQISLDIRPVWSEASLCALMIAKDLSFPHVASEDYDQTGRMPRLIGVFARRTCHLVDLVVRRLKYNKMNMWSVCEASVLSHKCESCLLLGYHCLPIVCPAKTRKVD